MKKLLPLIICLLLTVLFNTFSQKGATKPTNPNLHLRSSPSCPLVVSIQDNIPAAVCSELLKTLVAVTGSCTDTTAIRYRWSSNIGGVFSTSRTTTFNLPEFLITTPVTFTVWVVEGSDSLSANYTINIKPRPNSPSLTPFGTIILCDNNPVTLTSSACTGGSTTVWSNGASGVTSISVPAIGRTYYSVACYKNGCISDSTAAASFITGITTTSPTTISRTICEGTPITAGSGLQAQLVNCGNIGASGTYTYAGPTVGYDDGFRNNGGIDPSVIIPTGIGVVSKVKISITWRKQKGGFQNDCGVGDTQTWPYHNETQFRIKSPSGRIINLVYTGSYGGSDNPTVTTTFEDGMPPINYYSPPVSGTFSPAQPLSGFIGEDAAGTWTLLPYDAVWKDPLCVSGFAVTLVPNTQNGTVTWWDAPTGGNQLGSGTEFIPTVTAAGTYTYYAQGQCTLGCPSVRTATTLLIKPTPPVPTTSINIPLVNGVRSICYGESVTITATGCNNGGTVDWTDDFTAPDRLGSGAITGDTYTFIPVGGNVYSTTHTIKATCTGTNQCRSAFSTVISYTVKAKPSPPTISGSGTSACLNSVVTLTSSSTYGGTFGWTGNRIGNPISFALTSNTNIKVANTINGCTGDSSSVYSISTLPKPNKLTVNASQVQALCYGSSVTLTASACVGTIKWTGNLSGSPLTVTPLSSKDYKASCLPSNGCSSDSSTALNIIVLPKTKPVITGNLFVCGPTFTALIATGCSGVNETVVWRDESIGTVYNETITQTKTFRAVCIRNGYCVSDSSDIFTVQYRIKPSQPTITPPQNTTICQGTSVSLTTSACTGGISNWTGGLSGQTINVSPNTSKSYKVACVIDGCVSDSSLAVGLTVNPSPIISISSNKTSICSGDSAFLTLTGCTETISWSNGATTSIIKVSPISNTTYTATCTLGSCSSNQSLGITVLSTPYITTSGLLQCGQTVTLTANNVPVGSNIQWRKDGVDIVGGTNNTLVINSVGGYDFTVGATFSQQFQINTTSYSDIRFVDLNNGYVFNANNLWKTTNGGTSWVNVYSHTSNFEDVYFVDNNNGWAITQQNILKTTNGGLNWTIYNNYWSGVTLSKMTFKNLNTGIIITNDGRSLSTTNGGVTWTLNINPVESNISSWQFKKLLYIPNTNNILLAYRSNGTILVKLIKSIDNGISWTTILFPNVSYFSGLEDISFVDSNNGWLVGYEYDKLLMKTVDGGNTWTRLNPIMSQGNYNKIDFITPQIGYVQGFDNLTYTNRIYKTKDGGATWSTFRNIDIENSYVNTYNLKIDFISEDNGWYLYQATNIFQYVLKKASTPQCSTTPKVIAPPQRQNPPTITQPTNSTICQGSSLPLSATGCTGGTFAWTGGLTGTSISVSPSATKAYKVACTLNSCVSDSSSAVTVTVTPKPILPIINLNTPTICIGQNITLSINPINGATYGWTGGFTGTSISVTPLITKIYKVASTLNNCRSDSASITVNVISTVAPTISLGGEVCTNILPVKVWDMTVPNTGDDNLRSIINTNDGANFMLFEGLYGGVTGIQKTSSIGNMQWARGLYIPSGYSEMKIAVATNDGGYLIGGKNNSTSIGGEVSSSCRLALGNLPSMDFWILKVDANGTKQWDKRFGGNGEDDLNDLIKTTDGGYLLGGSSASDQGYDVSEPGYAGSRQYWAVKIDASGNKIWDKKFSPQGSYPTDFCSINSLLQTNDGGYLLGGNGKPAYDPLNNSAPRTDDFFLIKINSSGVKQWQAFYDNNAGGEYLKSMQPTSDGGFLLLGNTDANANNGDIWIVKINSNGVKQWDKRFGGTGNDQASILKSVPNENNFLIAGTSNSGINGDKSEASKGGYDMWLLKITQDGNKIWDKTLGGDRYDYANALAVNNDASIIIGGGSNSSVSADKNLGAYETYYDPMSGNTYFRQDSWFIKIASNCPVQSSTNILRGDSITLKANPCIGTVNWSNGMIGNSIVIQPVFNTTYTATCSANCTSPSSSPFTVSVTGGICETIKSGFWSDPTVWACGIIPTANENVIINMGHSIIGLNGILHAKTLTYRGGTLQLNTITNLILGN